jgi:integrase
MLTDLAIRRLPPGKLVWDMPGFAVRVSKKGRPSFYAARRRRGAKNLTWVLLGHYPSMSLAAARAKARETLLELAEGRKTAAHTFASVATTFIERLEAGQIPKARGSGPLRDVSELVSLIRRELVPVFGNRPIAEIARRDVIDLVEAVVRRGGAQPRAGTRRRDGGPYAARHTLAAARRLFDWAVDRDLLAASPCATVKAKAVHGTPARRDRVLQDEELKAVWHAATGYPYGSIVRLLILTGQRRGEIAGMRWVEIDFDRALLEISAERMKMNVGHVVPLTPAAVELISGLPRLGPAVFGDFSGFSKAKARLNRVSGIAAYTLHDLRRTVRTRLAELGVLPFVAELVIGHAQTGIHADYDLHRYDAEKRDALERWERRLIKIIG